MIEKFEVKSFKSLVDVTVELGNINVFVGANGSGKSNLLEAIGVISAAATGRVDDGRLLEKGVRPGLPRLYKTSFKDIRTSSEIRLVAEGSGCQYEVGLYAPMNQQAPEPWRFHTERLEIIGGKKLVGRSHHSSSKLNPEAGLAALKMVEFPVDSPQDMIIDSLQNYGIYSPATDFLRGVVSDPSQRVPVGLRGGRLPEAVMGFKGFLDPAREDILGMIDWAERFSASTVDNAPQATSVPSSKMVLLFHDRYMNRERNTLTGYDASEGALFVLFNAVMALHPKSPNFLAIDNADHGLNPRLAKSLMASLCRWVLEYAPHRQMLLTTHNPLILDGLPLNDDRVRLFTVDRSRKGHTVVRRVIVDEKIRKMAKEGWTLSRLWVMGHLGGGVPNV